MLKILSHHTWRGFGSDFLFLIDVSNNAHKVKKSHFNAASPTAVSSDVCRQCPIHTCADRQHCTETQTCAHPSRAARVRGVAQVPPLLWHSLSPSGRAGEQGRAEQGRGRGEGLSLKTRRRRSRLDWVLLVTAQARADFRGAGR